MSSIVNWLKIKLMVFIFCFIVRWLQMFLNLKIDLCSVALWLLISVTLKINLALSAMKKLIKSWNALKVSLKKINLIFESPELFSIIIWLNENDVQISKFNQLAWHDEHKKCVILLVHWVARRIIFINWWCFVFKFFN